jgi:hypothetical protein
MTHFFPYTIIDVYDNTSLLHIQVLESDNHHISTFIIYVRINYNEIFISIRAYAYTNTCIYIYIYVVSLTSKSSNLMTITLPPYSVYMYMYICVYMYIHIHIWIYMCVNTYICMKPPRNLSLPIWWLSRCHLKEGKYIYT